MNIHLSILQLCHEFLESNRIVVVAVWFMANNLFDRLKISVFLIDLIRRLNFIPRIQVTQQLHGCFLTSGFWDRRTWCHNQTGIEFWLNTVIWFLTYLLWRGLSFSVCLVLLLLISLLLRRWSRVHLFFGWRCTRHKCLLVFLILLHVWGCVIWKWLIQDRSD